MSRNKSLKPIIWILAGLLAAAALAALGPSASAQSAGAENPAAPWSLSLDPEEAKLGTVFWISDPVGRNNVTFTSQAPLEDIVGTSNQITGYVVFDPSKPAAGGRGRFSVPVAGLKTGIPMRDEHLQSTAWLDATGHPEIRFRITGTSDVEIAKDTDEAKTLNITLQGEFSLHGVTKAIAFPARVTWLKETPKTKQRLPGNLLAGRASFELALADFGIQGPPNMEVIGSKLAETIELSVSFMATDVRPADSVPASQGSKR